MSGKIFVSGATGYLARHIIRELLDQGHEVVGSLRDPSLEGPLRDALTQAVSDPFSIDGLELKTLDLTRDNGWDSAMKGCSALIHTASPFPMKQPSDERDLLRPAIDGTLRALRGAQNAGISRVVLTSSVAAVMDCPLREDQTAYDETNWSNTDGNILPYSKSKTLAEKAAWDFIAGEGEGMELTAINPSMIIGAPIGTRFGTSVSVIRRILNGRDPMVPRLGFGYCHVQDVARAHVAALTTPKAIGERFVVDSGFLWMEETARHLKGLYPDRKIAQRVAPDFLIRTIGLFDKAIGSVTPTLGQRRDLSHDKLERILGIRPVPALDAVTETSNFLIENNLVD